MAKSKNSTKILYMKGFFSFLLKGFNLLSESLNWASNLFVLAIRIYLAKIFLWAGYLKATDWTTTVYSFQNDFKVDYLSPEVAAYFGTGLEILLPFLLFIGLGGRIPALGLFIFNYISVISYPILMTPAFDCARKDHILWGVLILVPIFYSHGKISLDYLLQKKVNKQYKF